MVKETNQDQKTLDWVQLLRGIAALLVVFTHARYFFFGTPQWGIAEQVFRPGAMGVDLFFIISGFIMAYSTANSDGSFSYALNFAVKRFARIWPMYAVVTIAFVLITTHGFSYFQDSNKLVVFAKSLAFIPADPTKTLYFGLTLPLGWTLEFEMYFYAVFGMSLLFKRLRWFVLAAWMVLTIFIIPLDQRGFSMDVKTTLEFSYDYIHLMTSPIILEFLAGVLIGRLYLSTTVRIKNRNVCFSLLGLSISFAIWYAYSRMGDYHGPTKWGWPLALMVLVMAITSKTVHIKSPKVLVWLGTISFSLYLTHTLSQHIVTSALTKLNLESATHTWGHIFITTAFAIVVAAVTHRFLEKGLSEAVRRWLLALIPQSQRLSKHGAFRPSYKGIS